MKVLAIIGSLRKKHTYEQVKKFEQAHDEYGGDHEYEYLFVKDLDIKQCRGCFLCISRGEDKCPLKDELALLLRKIEEADCIILAAPNYVMNVNWLTKNLIDRLAYTLHRPAHYTKRFIVMVSSGNFMGARQASNALSLLASGGKIIGNRVAY